MKLKYFALSMAFVMAVALTGCSANRDSDSTESIRPTNTVMPDANDRSSADIDGAQSSNRVDDDIGAGSNAQNSAYIDNDAAQGGGAGGTNDRNNDGTPDSSNAGSAGANRNPSETDRVIDDIGDAAGDLARGAGNAVRDAGDAIGNAANDVGRAMR